MRLTGQLTGLSLLLGNVLPSPALATDRHPEASFYTDGGSLPAVDGVNAKAFGFGGGAAGNGFYGGAGAIAIPLGFRYGLQIDGILADFDSDLQGNVTAGGTAAHLFWRDPSVGLLGFYGHYVHADAFSGIDVLAGGAEGALYLGRFTLEAVAGAQGGEADLGLLGTANIETRFFDVALLAFYPTDNLELSVGHSYLFGTNAALFGAEWGFGAGRTMASLFARGSVSEGGQGAVLGGLLLLRPKREDADPASTRG